MRRKEIRKDSLRALVLQAVAVAIWSVCYWIAEVAANWLLKVISKTLMISTQLPYNTLSDETLDRSHQRPLSLDLAQPVTSRYRALQYVTRCYVDHAIEAAGYAFQVGSKRLPFTGHHHPGPTGWQRWPGPWSSLGSQGEGPPCDPYKKVGGGGPRSSAGGPTPCRVYNNRGTHTQAITLSIGRVMYGNIRSSSFI